MAYTVERCEAANTFKNDFGEFQVWKLQVHDGEKSIEAELNTKVGKDGPSIGEVIEGTLTKGQYGYKLKRAAPNGSGASGGGLRHSEDPKKSAEIRRMASQKVAVALLAAEVAAGLTFENSKASDLLKPRIDFFEKDAREAGERA